MSKLCVQFECGLGGSYHFEDVELRASVDIRLRGRKQHAEGKGALCKMLYHIILCNYKHRSFSICAANDFLPL